jgi:RNA polymerase sigma-70 factor (ECF subfamily)
MQELDELTLARARRGDQAALAELIHLHGRDVYALVGRMMVRYPQRVEDLSQDTLIKVLRGLSRFDPRGPAKLSTWILTIATRTCIDALRRERPNPVLADTAALPGLNSTPEQVAAGRELAHRVHGWMGQLPDDQRAVLILRGYHDLDYGEIARALGIKEGTVKSRLGRARETLRRRLQQAQEPVPSVEPETLVTPDLEPPLAEQKSDQDRQETP